MKFMLGTKLKNKDNHIGEITGVSATHYFNPDRTEGLNYEVDIHNTTVTVQEEDLEKQYVLLEE